MKKKLLFLFLALYLVLFGVGFSTQAIQAAYQDNTVISVSEVNAITNLMNNRGLRGEVQVDILHDVLNEPVFCWDHAITAI